MKEGPDIALVAALIGDPARANMLTALMTGKALTANELASEAGVTVQTASSHLAKLGNGGLLEHRRQGRHKYFTLASDEVAQVLEGLMGLAAGAGHLRQQTGPKDQKLRKARVCYNHLAGDMGTKLFDSLLSQGHLVRDGEQVLLTPQGADLAHSLNIDVAALRAKRTPVCLECLDWSERRSHLAGSLGRAFLKQFEELHWLRRDPDTRVVTFTHKGQQGFQRMFGL